MFTFKLCFNDFVFQHFSWWYSKKKNNNLHFFWLHFKDNWDDKKLYSQDGYIYIYNFLKTKVNTLEEKLKKNIVNDWGKSGCYGDVLLASIWSPRPFLSLKTTRHYTIFNEIKKKKKIHNNSKWILKWLPPPN